MSYIGTNDQVVNVLLRKVLTADNYSIFNAGLEFWDNQWEWGAVLRLSIDHLLSTMCGSVVVNRWHCANNSDDSMEAAAWL